MRQSLLYFIAAGLFAIATGLNLYNDGPNLKTGIGLVFAWALLMLAFRMRRAGN
jgi:hypothetical protein